MLATALAVVVTVSTVGLTSVAYADEIDVSAGAVVAIEDSAPDVLEDVADVPTGTTGEEAINSTVAGTSISVPTDPQSGIIFDTASGPALTIGLPSAATAEDAEVIQNGVVAYDNNNGSTTVPVVKDNGSVQIATTISGPEAPETYRYPLTLPSGATIAVTEYGGAIVTASDGTLLATVDPAWAMDANGNDVPTHYVVEGATLVQVVEHKLSNAAYPITADPWWGTQFKISSTAANRLIAVWAGGAGAAGIVAAICTGTIVGLPCGAVAGIVAGLLALGSAAIGWCNAAGRGIYVNVSWSGVVWCTSR
ncbi:MAG: hypothetical protein JWM52_490 [Candidatus Saccharibacteria bacterium]|nr:hypothetical protein [Candidatus Saccharibacteria bacterium]